MLTIYSKNNCAFCGHAKTLLTNKNVQFEEINIEHDSVAKEFILSQGHRTVPQIYKNGLLFVEGGYQGLVKLSDEQFDQLSKENDAS